MFISGNPDKSMSALLQIDQRFIWIYLW